MGKIALREVGTLHSGSSDELLIALRDRNVEIGDLLYIRLSDSSWMVLQAQDRTVINLNKESALYAYSRIGRVEGSSIMGSPHIDVVNAKPLYQVFEGRSGLQVTTPTQIPPGGSKVYVLEDGDEELAQLSIGISRYGSEGFLGYLRSGRRAFKKATINIDWGRAIPHQVLVTGMTGSGKSNFVKNLLAWYVSKPIEEHDVKISFLVLDHHSEYHGERLEVEGLRGLPRRARENRHIFKVYLPSHYYERLEREISLDPTLYSPLKIPSSLLEPDHVSLFGNFTEAQTDLLHLLYSIAQNEGKSWVRMLVEEGTVSLIGKIKRHGISIKDVTVETLRRRIIRVLGFRIRRGSIDDSYSMFSLSDDERYVKVFEGIVDSLSKGGIVVLDFSAVPEVQSTLASASIIERVFEDRMGGAPPDSVVAIVSEEAPKYLNPKMARNPANIFAKVAREGRKFNIGLIAITQSCSLIERQIIANMNTIVAFRTSYRGDLDLLSQAGVESRELPHLLKGEAVVHSTFLNVTAPIPVKYPRASEYLGERFRGLEEVEKPLKDFEEGVI